MPSNFESLYSVQIVRHSITDFPTTESPFDSLGVQIAAGAGALVSIAVSIGVLVCCCRYCRRRRQRRRRQRAVAVAELKAPPLIPNQLTPPMVQQSTASRSCTNTLEVILRSHFSHICRAPLHLALPRAQQPHRRALQHANGWLCGVATATAAVTTVRSATARRAGAASIATGTILEN